MVASFNSDWEEAYSGAYRAVTVTELNVDTFLPRLLECHATFRGIPILGDEYGHTPHAMKWLRIEQPDWILYVEDEPVWSKAQKRRFIARNRFNMCSLLLYTT